MCGLKGVPPRGLGGVLEPKSQKISYSPRYVKESRRNLLDTKLFLLKVKKEGETFTVDFRGTDLKRLTEPKPPPRFQKPPPLG